MPVVAYATDEELTAYNPSLGGTEAEREAALNEGARDIDRYLHHLPFSSTAPVPLKLDVTYLSDALVEGLRRANLAQAEWRLVQGPNFFIQPSGTVTQGPDFTITTGEGGGGAGDLSPKAKAELRAYGLMMITARARP